MNNLNNLLSVIFSNIVSLSFKASIVAIIILVIGRLFKNRINPRLSCFLWVFVLIRLIIPVLPETPLSLFNVFGSSVSDFMKPDKNHKPENPTGNRAWDSLTKNNASNTSQGSTPTAAKPQPENTATPEQENIYPGTGAASIQITLQLILAYIWFSIALFIIMYISLSNILFCRKIRQLRRAEIPEIIINELKSKLNIKRKVTVKESSEISSPCVFGLKNSIVLIPKGMLDTMDSKALSAILLHELAHIKRLDLPVNLLWSILCGVHWFNPVIWYSSFVLKRNQELCADAFAMLFMTEEQIHSYGRTILQMSRKHIHSPGTMIISAGINQNNSTLKDRIISIANFSQKKYTLSFAAIVLFVILGVFLCSSPSNYSGTAEEKMNLQNNILLSVTSAGSKNNLQNIDLQIHNNSRIKLYDCKLEIFDGPPDGSKSNLVYTSKDFNISAENKLDFDISELNYNNAFFELSYSAGFSIFEKAPGGISGQLKAFDKTTDINNWGVVTSEEISAFIENEKINAIGTTKIYDFYTVVLFQQGNTTGYFELWKDTKSNKLLSRKVQGFSEQKPPIVLAGGTASGNYPFANIIINDERLFALGNEMLVEGTEKTIEIPIADKQGYTFETRSFGQLRKITVIDKDNKVLCLYSIPEYHAELFLPEVSFESNNAYSQNIFNENGYKITDQKPVDLKVEFNSKMFTDDYSVAYKAANIDYKIPLARYKNSTLYLKGIYEANEGPEFLYADMYFIHDIKGNKTSSILSTLKIVNSENRSSSLSGNVIKDVLLPGNGTLKDMVSLRSNGPSDRICIYLKRDLLEKTKGNFTVEFEDLNEISYIKD
ncbi:MAG: hypothetical protein K0R50_767 [Eubacterium sp.]|jgi:beta-lactamase regulating signal transducer with metallopeptidase domain|nr:hypothetical protein [Eubacterium sp.]